MPREPKEPTAATARKIKRAAKSPDKSYDKTKYTITLRCGATFTGSAYAILVHLKQRTNNTVIPYRLKAGITTEIELLKPNHKVKGRW